MLNFSLKLETRLLLTSNDGIIEVFPINESLRYGPIRFVRSAWVV